jgi:hypothetical protein
LRFFIHVACESTPPLTLLNSASAAAAVTALQLKQIEELLPVHKGQQVLGLDWLSLKQG